MHTHHTHEVRSPLEAASEIRQDGYTFALQKPDWTPDAHKGVAGFGPYQDWAGLVDPIVRDFSGPDKVIVIVRGPNGAGKDHLAAEVAGRMQIPYHLTVLEPDTTSTSLICFPLLPIERGVFALSAHTTAQVTGRLSVITEGGKGDHKFNKVLAPQATAYDDHRVVQCNQPQTRFPVHPDHALMILALPGEEIQRDIESRAAHYDLGLPPPEILQEIIKAKTRPGEAALLDALREYVSEQWAAGKPMPPRAAITALTIAHKDYIAAASTGRLSAREARRIIDRSVTRVRY